ncbi:hypothetical protein ACU8KH_01637 [Lachancea thermotolerans]
MLSRLNLGIFRIKSKISILDETLEIPIGFQSATKSPIQIEAVTRQTVSNYKKRISKGEQRLGIRDKIAFQAILKEFKRNGILLGNIKNKSWAANFTPSQSLHDRMCSTGSIYELFLTYFEQNYKPIKISYRRFAFKTLNGSFLFFLITPTPEISRLQVFRVFMPLYKMSVTFGNGGNSKKRSSFELLATIWPKSSCSRKRLVQMPFL